MLTFKVVEVKILRNWSYSEKDEGTCGEKFCHYAVKHMLPLGWNCSVEKQQRGKQHF